jgi:hypothetical protein
MLDSFSNLSAIDSVLTQTDDEEGREGEGV